MPEGSGAGVDARDDGGRERVPEGSEGVGEKMGEVQPWPIDVGRVRGRRRDDDETLTPGLVHDARQVIRRRHGDHGPEPGIEDTSSHRRDLLTGVLSRAHLEEIVLGYAVLAGVGDHRRDLVVASGKGVGVRRDAAGHRDAGRAATAVEVQGVIEAGAQDLAGTVRQRQRSEDDDRAAPRRGRGDRATRAEVSADDGRAHHGRWRQENRCRRCGPSCPSHDGSILAHGHYGGAVTRDEAARALLQDFAREPGRSVYAEWGTWSGGVHDDLALPAASLAKLPLAMAVEPRLRDLAPRHVGDLVRPDDGPSVLYALDRERELSAPEMLRLLLSASDNPCARWAVDAVGMPAVAEAVSASGARHTTLEQSATFGVLGDTTARDAVLLLKAACDAARFPVTAGALSRALGNSRIPLGATGDDVSIAHKTGTLQGVAHDVARISCEGGDLWIAFLSEHQHDTLVTGYEMGICTRSLLELFGQRATSTLGVLAGG